MGVEDSGSLNLCNISYVMSINNQNIKSGLRIAIIALAVIAIADLALALTSGTLSQYFGGYSILVVPAVVIGAYAYLGMPIFHFDADSKVLHIKSHMGFSNIFGKELYILKKNILRFEIDTVRIRKKLTVHYLKDGKEFNETFSISLLSDTKIEHLAHKVDLIQSENGWSANQQQLFI